MKTEKEILDAVKANKQANVKLLEELEQLKNQPAKEWMEKEWLNARNNGGLSHDKCWTFYKTPERKKEEWMFQQDFKNGKLYYSYYRTYLILSEQYSMKETDVDILVKDVLGKDINCEGLTPTIFNTPLFPYWERI